MTDPYRKLARRIHEVAHHAAHRASPPVTRFKVTKADPLVIAEIGGDLVLEEGDPDVEIDERLMAGNPEPLPDVDDVVAVKTTPEGIYIVSNLLTE